MVHGTLTHSIISEFTHLFDNSNNEPIKQFYAEIIMDDSYRPIFHKAYDVPYSLKEKVAMEIGKLIQEKILSPIKYSDNASPVVIVPKKDGALRLCVDFKKNTKQVRSTRSLSDT